MSVEFDFAPGAHFQKGARPDPQVVGEHLEYLREQHGGELTARVVLDDAREKRSPLHPLFEWNDSEAAEQFRLKQAGNVIRAVVVRFRTNSGGEPRMIRAFAHVSGGGKPHYMSVEVAMSAPDTRAEVLRKAWDEMQRVRAKYANMSEFALIWATLDEIEGALPPVIAAE